MVVDPSGVSLSKLDSAGKAIWSRAFDGSAGANVDPGTTLATDANGDPVSGVTFKSFREPVFAGEDFAVLATVKGSPPASAP